MYYKKEYSPLYYIRQRILRYKLYNSLLHKNDNKHLYKCRYTRHRIGLYMLLYKCCGRNLYKYSSNRLFVHNSVNHLRYFLHLPFHNYTI